MSESLSDHGHKLPGQKKKRIKMAEDELELIRSFLEKYPKPPWKKADIDELAKEIKEFTGRARSHGTLYRSVKIRADMSADVSFNIGAKEDKRNSIVDDKMEACFRKLRRCVGEMLKQEQRNSRIIIAKLKNENSELTKKNNELMNRVAELEAMLRRLRRVREAVEQYQKII